MSFLRRPQATTARAVLFQLHLWTGLAAGLYALVIGLSGAALAFRPQIQASAHPAYFAPRPPGALEYARPELVMDGLRTAFPGYRFSAIEYPTYRRGTFLTYVARGDELRTVFSDAVSGRVLGALPTAGWLHTLQELHYNLLAGRTGIVVNGIGAACLLLLCVTGAVIWWPGLARWRQHLRVTRGRGWKRVAWELHGATGIWMSALLVMWAVSGIYFSFPGGVRGALGRVAPLTEARWPSSPARETAATASPSRLVDRARLALPGAHVARLFLPSGPSGVYAVVLATDTHGDHDTSDEVTFYFDQYSGGPLGRSDHTGRTAGDRLLAWLGPLHMGTFGGWPVRLAWLVTGLAFPLLFLTGLIMWWNRVARPAVAARVRAST